MFSVLQRQTIICTCNMHKKFYKKIIKICHLTHQSTPPPALKTPPPVRICFTRIRRGTQAIFGSTK